VFWLDHQRDWVPHKIPAWHSHKQQERIFYNPLKSWVEVY